MGNVAAASQTPPLLKNTAQERPGWINLSACNREKTEDAVVIIERKLTQLRLE